MRVPVSCSVCRKRKVKCDRKKPHCTNCVRHNQEYLCVYSEKADLQNARSSVSSVLEVPQIAPVMSRRRTNESIDDTTYKFPRLDSNKPVFNEIKMLKSKIRQIETSISMADMSQQHANVTVERQLPLPLTSSPGMPNQQQKLPSIQSFSPTPYLPVPSPSQFPPTTRYSNHSYTRHSTLSDTPNSTGKSASFDFLFSSTHVDLTEKIDFFTGVPVMMYKYSRVHSYGPLSLLSSILNDKLTGPVRDQVMKFKKKNMFNGVDPKNFKKMIVGTSGMQDIEPVQADSPAEHGLLLDTNSSQHVMAQIIEVLPPPKVMWMLVDRFFQFVYPMSPYLDQKSFIKDIQRLTNTVHGNASEVKITKLSISRKLDIAIAGSLLLVLRLSYMTLSSNLETSLDFPPKSSEDLYLLSRDLNPKLMDVAQLCLNQFSLLGRCALPIFQCALLMFEYKKIDSFDGFADGEAHIYINMLINIGISIGLNKDPSQFDPIVGDSPLGNLWRKIWYGLVASEHVQFSESRAAKGVLDGTFNTQLPFFKVETSNIENLELERKVIEMIRSRFELQKSTNDLIDSCVNMNVNPSVEYLLTRTLSIEADLLKKHGTFKDLLLKDHHGSFLEKIDKLYSIINYLQTISMMQPIYFKVLQYFDDKENIPAAKFFTYKTHSIFMYILFNFHELACHTYRYLGPGFDMFITPVIEVVTHKAWFVLMSLCCKTFITREIIHSQPPTTENRNKLAELKIFRERLTEFTDKYYLPALTILSSKYFYAWRILKAHKFIIQLLKDRQIEYTKEKELFNVVKHMSSEDMAKLNELNTIHNYNTKLEPTKFGKALLERIGNNICDDDPRFGPLQLSTFSGAPMTFATPFAGEVNEINASPNDDFWFGMYTKLGKNMTVNDPSIPAFSKSDFNDIVAEYGLNDEKFAATPTNFASKDDFVDQTIFDMFN